MTYCVGLCLDEGLVLLSDTRTNAGVDHISTFSKMCVTEVHDDRVLVILSAGNLAISQAVIAFARSGVEVDGSVQSLGSVPDMFAAAQLLGAAVRKVHGLDGKALGEHNVSFDVSLLLGGQIKGDGTRLFQIYAAGNFIEATADTPFFQIGEHKYGKPILDRVVRHDTDLKAGVKLVLVSMDSTLRSNLTVGLPIDLLVYRRDSLRIDLRRRITEDDPYFRSIAERWSAALRDAYRALPDME
ncbi:proteasome-type protease [Azospirillum sp. TSO22-1]|uniref:proteasome-type protease n=1 Tax=Azospirillum sp. TSO22-1 TaxID=716789 RepID=UPI000D605FBF|nr:proteasome-type protease [Azospirillum sp. TSO22-1]PWC56997.1 peptidase [Azospirillum sp. TSO22-1]